MYLAHDVDPELAAICCALNNAEAAEALKELNPEDMPSREGAEILTAIKLLAHVDLVTVNEHTDYKHTEYVLEAFNFLPTTAMYRHYIDMLKDRAKRKRIRREAQALITRLNDMTEDTDDAVATFEAAITKQVVQLAESIPAHEATFRFIDSVDATAPEARTTFGIPGLDQDLGGIFGGKLVVVGARPATGKTALAISAAVSTQRSGDVLFCSYEMAPTEIMGRIMASLSGVNAQRIAYRDLDTDLKIELGKHYGEAAKMRIHFSSGANTPAKIRREAMRLNKSGKLALIVVDYLQLMNSGVRAESRRVEVGQISRQLKQLAMELDIPVLALSQLNRQSEQTASKAPTMAEMRESGDIEQDADVIVLMYIPPNDSEYIQDIASKGYRCVRLLLEKNRQGISGVATDTAFDGARMRFMRISEVIDGATS